MSVDTTHLQYDEYQKSWEQIADCFKGSRAIKGKGTRYLPNPDENDEERYKSYLQRALFSNFTARTAKTLNSGLFKKEPVVELPADLEYMLEDADNQRNGLVQVCKSLGLSTVMFSRAGLLVDFTRLEAPQAISKAEEKLMGPRAYFATYAPLNIINWKVEGDKLKMVVLLEHYEDAVDEFKSNTLKQYRVLKLDGDGYYVQELWRDSNVVQTYEPRKANGERLDYIPFYFIGASDNKPSVDDPLMFDLSDVNISHYISSADNAESEFLCGQPTVAIATNMDSEEFQAANPNGVRIGSRYGHNLGPEGSMTMVQADPNTMARQSMKDKEEIMLMIGARLITNSAGNKTVDEARRQSASEMSELESIAQNISSAIRNALVTAYEFMSPSPGSTDDIQFKLQPHMFEEQTDAQVLNVVMQLAMGGYMAYSDVFNMLKRFGLISEDRNIEDMREEVQGESPIS